jgi:hypothetical protein
METRIIATETKISGQMSSLGIASEESSPPTTATGKRHSISGNRFVLVILLA